MIYLQACSGVLLGKCSLRAHEIVEVRHTESSTPPPQNAQQTKQAPVAGFFM